MKEKNRLSRHDCRELAFRLLFAKDFVFRMLPVFLLGAWIYTRRELALVSKRG